jgi:hypothetical protein
VAERLRQSNLVQSEGHLRRGKRKRRQVTVTVGFRTVELVQEELGEAVQFSRSV